MAEERAPTRAQKWRRRQGIWSHDHLESQEEEGELQRIQSRMGRDACQDVPEREILGEWLPVLLTCRRARDSPAAACVGAMPERLVLLQEHKRRLPFGRCHCEIRKVLRASGRLMHMLLTINAMLGLAVGLCAYENRPFAQFKACAGRRRGGRRPSAALIVTEISVIDPNDQTRDSNSHTPVKTVKTLHKMCNTAFTVSYP
jgi:hypothetical protein